MANSPDHKAFAADEAYAPYIQHTFAPEDVILQQVRQRALDAKMPAIHVSPYDGRHLQTLARAAGARKIVEIGTLAGYSGICLARALIGIPAAVLHTFEFDPKHAEVARASFRSAGLDALVHLHLGKALEQLPTIENQGPFDLVFIDADKENYPNYLTWAAQHLRIGGTVLVDNAFAWGLTIAAKDDPRLKEESQRKALAAIDAVNRQLGDPHGPWLGTMIPTGEGLAMGVKIR